MSLVERKEQLVELNLPAKKKTLTADTWYTFDDLYDHKTNYEAMNKMILAYKKTMVEQATKATAW